ncbi:MAG: 1-deoxy-D-xylulose-5-phosphate reductoisomerase [Akkermansiaceae bacterium]|nr:1-deoxy-D-xylulose-5-phosphate reductoisomerase [Akkermansiaceae bacterium]MDP4647767.1 1-deoxy-D-xylulose-5-phosphate reductoisomerase [Akkermansiaceae bacterium]MDP4780842.1 1-deoxy-D-xylulose-5-phosphate reductoisomerase [Akkermansiaceae bacterium]MDP4848416.1 1-deoxy-D-xylulose-5-phosphate reductoisomerase [Akkermansiaceae bacterium]MDP4896813.1 1-deoxy-D-xylulose-5-phosphate reductoisomerase [Akkermansiaceae bacterium]
MSSGKKRRVVLLGSTGSIGLSTLKVAENLPDDIEIIALAANSSVPELAAQALATGVKHVALHDASREAELRALLPPGVKIHLGTEGLLEISTLHEADIVLIAIVGTSGLQPALAAIEAGKDLAVASKEILVMAGEIITARAAEKGVRILPIDSEHNAIFQCLEGHRGSDTEISRLILTASGGPFRLTPAAELIDVTPEMAMNHPTWDMGPKITIDSATLFNKGLEMIEARWLFGIGMDRIEAVIHPQSIVHSMVEFTDGSVLAQLSNTDMCFPIQYALTYPARKKGNLKPIDFAELSKLEFSAPRTADFPALTLARTAGLTGGTLPAVYNAANEVAVEAFRAGKIKFPQIWETVAATMAAHATVQSPTLDQILAADHQARIAAKTFTRPA